MVHYYSLIDGKFSCYYLEEILSHNVLGMKNQFYLLPIHNVKKNLSINVKEQKLYCTVYLIKKLYQILYDCILLIVKK